MAIGWIKLHRKVLDNEIFMRDPTAWRIFEYLLLSVDRKTGSIETSKRQIAKKLKLKPSTVLGAFHRLATDHMIDLETDHLKSSITICNWKTYQDRPDHPTDHPTVSSPTTLLYRQEERSKEAKLLSTDEERPKSDRHEEWKNLPQPRPKYFQWLKEKEKE